MERKKIKNTVFFPRSRARTYVANVRLDGSRTFGGRFLSHEVDNEKSFIKQKFD